MEEKRFTFAILESTQRGRKSHQTHKKFRDAKEGRRENKAMTGRKGGGQKKGNRKGGII